MYICICKGVTDTQLRVAINNGLCTRRQLTHCLGVGKDCGKCNQAVKGLLNDVNSDGTLDYNARQPMYSSQAA